MSRQATETTQKLIQTALAASSGAFGGGVTAGLVKIVDNILKSGKMKEGDLTFIHSPKLKHAMWEWLIIHSYVTDEEITEKCDELTNKFPERLPAELV